MVVEDKYYIPYTIRDQMIQHCQNETPFEACGLLSGSSHVARRIWPMMNTLKSTVSFSMDVDQMREVFERIEEEGEVLTGIYHSHPTAPPIPSPQDIAHIQYDDTAYLIVSLANGETNTQCYSLKHGNVMPIHMEFIPNAHFC